MVTPHNLVCLADVLQGRLSHRSRMGTVWSVHVAAPIVLGVCIYLLFRSQSILVFHWFELLGLAPFVASLRDITPEIQLPIWFIYSLPDGIWVYAATTWLILIWRPAICWPWLTVPVTLALTSEIGQAVELMPGTYQLSDVVLYISGFIMSLAHVR